MISNGCRPTSVSEEILEEVDSDSESGNGSTTELFESNEGVFIRVQCVVDADLTSEKCSSLRSSRPTLSMLSVPCPNRSRSIDGRIRTSAEGRRSSSGRCPRYSDGVMGDIRRLCLSRDAVQPASGSLSDLRCQSLPAENEELDVLTALEIPMLSHRPRSFTCPDMKSIKRKAKMKAMNRPPTPPPSDITSCINMDILKGGEAFTGRRSRKGSKDLDLSNSDEFLPVITET